MRPAGGRRTPRSGTEHSLSPERLVELDVVYDIVDYTDMTEQDVDDHVIAEVRRIVGSTRDSTTIS